MSLAACETEGTAQTLTTTDPVHPTWTAPPVPAGGATLTFQLVVRDGTVSSAPAAVNVTVTPKNQPPDCARAQATPAQLWPPNHALRAVAVTGVTDPENQPVTLTVTDVRQDEPVNGQGDGDTSPDAVVQAGNTVQLRAERAGGGARLCPSECPSDLW